MQPDTAIAAVPLFASLTDEQVTQVAQRLRRQVFHERDVIVRRDTPGDALFIITTGKVKVTYLEEEGETIIARFPNRFDLTNKPNADPFEKPYNLNEYDVILAFDPDWTELSQQQAEDLGRWVREGGGGLIYVAGPINTFQLARTEETNGRLTPLLNILPVVPADIVAQRIKPIPKVPRRLHLHPERIIGSDLLKLDDKVPDDPKAGWERYFTDATSTPRTRTSRRNCSRSAGSSRRTR